MAQADATGVEDATSGRDRGVGSLPLDSVNMSEMVGAMRTTARRRTESVQVTPVAVSAFESNDLQARDVRRLADLDSQVPNLSIDNAVGAANAARITLRGVGQGDFISSVDQAVGVYVDGVYAPRSQGLLAALYDVEQVEVVRGPQGTLFGKNTIGGAINVTTRRPDFVPGGEASLRVGNFDRFDTRLSVNVPLVPERVAARVSVATNYDDGYQKNTLLDQRPGNDRFLGVRGQLMVLPTTDVEILLSGVVTRENRLPQAGKCRVTGAVGVPIPVPEVQEVFSRNLAACAQDSARSDRKSASDLGIADDDLRTALVSAQVGWEINDRWMLKSITSYRSQDDDLRQDLDSTAVPLAQPLLDSGRNEQRSFTQELQLTGRSAGDALIYVAGLYAFSEEIDDRQVGGVGSVGGITALLPVVNERLSVNNRSFAAYGQLTYALTERLSVSAGLRRTLERKRVRKRDALVEDGLGLQAGDINFEFERSKRFDDFSPNASISFQVTPKLLTYANYSTGFRGGGFNGRATALNPDIARVSPEELTTYEVGLKSTFLGERLLFNAATFYSIYDDIQRPVIASGPAGLPALVVRNVSESRIRGAEIEIVALPITGLRLETALSALRSRSDFDIAADPRIRNARLPNTPNYILTFGAAYEQPVGTLGNLGARVQWRHQGAEGNDLADSRAVRQNKYGLLDGRLGLELADGRTEIAVFGSNLLNRSFINNGFDLSDSTGTAVVFEGSPRRYGIELNRKF